MLQQQKKGYPKEDEIVMCTVQKVNPHSVFARLDEYGTSGMIHISEVSPGRIRNIRDFVKEGKVIVCKVLRIVRDKGYIDLSLRRVNEAQRKGKVNEVKQEQKAEKIIEFVAKNLKKDYSGIFKLVIEASLKKYDSIYSCFEDVVEKGLELESLGISRDIAAELETAIRQRITPPQVTIGGNLILKSYEPDGVEVIRKALKAAQSASDTLKVTSDGSPKYKLIITDSNYKDAEKTLKIATEKSIKIMEKHHSTGEFQRIDIEK